MSDDENNGTERRGDYRVLKAILGEHEKHNKERHDTLVQRFDSLDEGVRQQLTEMNMRIGAHKQEITQREDKCSTDLWAEVNKTKEKITSEIRAHEDNKHDPDKRAERSSRILAIVVSIIAILIFVKEFVLGR